MKLVQKTISKLRRLIKRNQQPGAPILPPALYPTVLLAFRLRLPARLAGQGGERYYGREVDVNLCVTGSIEVAATVGWVMKTNCPFPYYFLILRLLFRRLLSFFDA